ncbi:hypothetical protein AKJ16_DCAP19237 [Drosera capensis]
MTHLNLLHGVTESPPIQWSPAASAGVVLSLLPFPPSPLSSPFLLSFFSPHTQRVASYPRSPAPVAELRRRPPHTAAKSHPDSASG